MNAFLFLDPFFNLGMDMTFIKLYHRLTKQGSNFIVAILAMAFNNGKMAMDKMKLYLKSEATFDPNGYFRKACIYLANCMDIFL